GWTEWGGLRLSQSGAGRKGGERRLGRRGAGLVGAVGGREVVRRGRLTGEEEAPVERRREGRARPGGAGAGIGVGAARQRVGHPAAGGDGGEAAAHRLAEVEGELALDEIGRRREARRLQLARDVAA